MPINMQGLLDSGLLQDLGTGLLSQSGWQQTPTTLGQTFGGAMQFANGRQADRLAMEAARQKIAQEKQRTQAMGQLQGLLTPQMTPAPVQVPTGQMRIQTPEGRAEALGLLSQVAPDAVAQSLMAQMFQPEEAPRYTSDMNEYIAVSGQQPGSPGFMDGYSEFLAQKAGAKSDPTQAKLLETQLAQALIETRNAIEEREARLNEAATDKRQTALNLSNDLDHLTRIADRTQQLQGTILETGLPLGDFRRGALGFTAMMQDLAGRDSEKAKELTRAYDDLNKLVSDFTMDTASRFSGSALTDSKLAMMVQSFANLKANPGTNLMIVGDTINQYLDAAEIDGVSVPDAERYRAFAAGLLSDSPETLTPSNDTGSVLTSGQTIAPELQSQIDALTAEIQALEAELRGQ